MPRGRRAASAKWPSGTVQGKEPLAGVGSVKRQAVCPSGPGVPTCRRATLAGQRESRVTRVGSSPRGEGVGTSPGSNLGVDPEPPVLPEFPGSLPPTELRLAFPGIAPAFRRRWRLPEPDQVIPTRGATNMEEAVAKAHCWTSLEGAPGGFADARTCRGLLRSYLSLFGCGGSGVLFGLQATPGLNAWGSARPSFTSCPYDCAWPPGPLGPEPSSGAPGSSFNPENEHYERPWF